MPAKLGQHFLKNTDAIKKIIAALEIQQNDNIVEIGPGKGALTFPLAEECIQKNCRLIAIEKDRELFSILKEKLKDNKNIFIVNGDALEELENVINKIKQSLGDQAKFKIVGNIPYYITGKLLRIISELKNKPENCILMVQKEVAERISAIPPHNNLLASATSVWANIKILLKLKASEFDPPPEVDSAVIQLIPNDKELAPEQLDKYYKLIHVIFKQPRKTLANNLKDGLDLPRVETENLITSVNLPLNSRPQDISVEQILKISDLTIS